MTRNARDRGPAAPAASERETAPNDEAPSAALVRKRAIVEQSSRLFVRPDLHDASAARAKREAKPSK